MYNIQIRYKSSKRRNFLLFSDLPPASDNAKPFQCIFANARGVQADTGGITFEIPAGDYAICGTGK